MLDGRRGSFLTNWPKVDIPTLPSPNKTLEIGKSIQVHSEILADEVLTFVHRLVIPMKERKSGAFLPYIPWSITFGFKIELYREVVITCLYTFIIPAGVRLTIMRPHITRLLHHLGKSERSLAFAASTLLFARTLLVGSA